MNDNKRILKFPSVKPPKYRGSIKSGKHGLWYSLLNAYNMHQKITISPDDVYNTICCLWAKYLLLNAEKFRNQIVSHEGQKELIYIADDHLLNDDNINRHMDAFLALIKQDNNVSTQWMNEKFSTTSTLDLFIRKTATLASQKEYYKFSSYLMCGLPEIVLLGTKEDWTHLRNTISKITTFDEHMVRWVGKLDYVLENFENGDENHKSFWQSPFTLDGGGSGSPVYYEGWATVFNPFTEKNTWGTTKETYGFVDGFVNRQRITEQVSYYRVKQTDVLDLTVDFTINLHDLSGKHYADWIIDAHSISEENNGFQIKNIFNYQIKEK